MKTLSIATGLAIFLSTPYCTAAEARAEPDVVRIRVANVSEVPFSEVVIDFPGREEDYGALEPWRTSEYRSVSLAYPYPAYRIVADGNPHRAVAIDRMGDERLMEGTYTYTIDFYDGRLIFGLIMDED